jgi:hypothetical protein
MLRADQLPKASSEMLLLLLPFKNNKEIRRLKETGLRVVIRKS